MNVFINIGNNKDYRKIFAIFLGVLATISLPPFHVTFILVFVFSALYNLIIISDNKKESFLIGWWFGFSFFATGLYWIVSPMLLDLKQLKQFIWTILITLFGLNAFLALYMGLFALSFYVLPKKNIIFFALLFTFFELLRGKLLSGFPWNYLSYSWGNNLEIMQITSIFGIEGLLFFTVLYCVIPVLPMQKISIANVIFYSSGIMIIVSMFIWGSLRLNNSQQEPSGVVIRLVQSGIKSLPNWKEKRAKDTVKTNIDLTLSKKMDDITHVVWSESSIPFLIGKDSGPFVAKLLKYIPKTIILGSDRKEYDKVFNSIFVMKGSMIFDHYDKIKLVPLGEFVPFRRFFFFVKMVTSPIGYSHGNEKKLLDYEYAFTPSICYESIFPGDFRQNHSNWIVNITNDSWFGTTSGPYQHFFMSRARTIESGLPMVRVASNGISAMFDSYGRIIAFIPLGKKGIVDAALPKKIPATPYSKYHLYIHWFFIFSGMLIIFWRLVHVYDHRKSLQKHLKTH